MTNHPNRKQPKHAIEIRVVGNRGLYRDLQASFASESTKHRTFSGAARRLLQLNRMSQVWSQTTGQWGSWSVFVDGVRLEDPIHEFDTWTTPDEYELRHSMDPQRDMANALRQRFGEVREQTQPR